MAYKRVLTMQDISCVGQCSMTVALPVLAACGVEACVLPTEILSTHTGGFWKPAVTYLDGSLGPIWRHWKESGIRFDAIYTGYLGSTAAIETAKVLFSELLAPGGITIVDPAMADHGRLYSGLDRKYAAAMKGLCDQADVILPNVTEGAMLAGLPLPETADDVAEILEKLPTNTVILTGTGGGEGETGVLLRQNGFLHRYVHRRIDKSCSGTGDLFAASFVGALMQGRTAQEAVKIAADFTCLCVETTAKDPAHWYGVKFEPNLPELIGMLRK